MLLAAVLCAACLLILWHVLAVTRRRGPIGRRIPVWVVAVLCAACFLMAVLVLSVMSAFVLLSLPVGIGTTPSGNAVLCVVTWALVLGGAFLVTYFVYRLFTDSW